MNVGKTIKLLKSVYWKAYRLIIRSDVPKICDDVLAWLESNKQHGKVIANIKSAFSIHFSHHERFLAVIRNPTIHTASGYIQLPTGEVILDTAWIPENIRGNWQYFSRLKNKGIKKEGRWFSIILYWSENYFHWFCDVLPRLYQLLDKLPPDTQFIVAGNMEDWKIKSLFAAGIPLEKMIRFDGSVPWILDELYYTPPIAMTGDIEPQSIKWVQSVLAKLCHNDLKTIAGTNIYLSRQKAQRRRIVNEQEVVAFLTEKGFSVVYAEDYTLDEQICIFSRAEFVVAPHGAGLTNILHCKPGTKILEIFDSTIIRRCYWSLANALDLSYVCFMGKHVHHDLKGEGDIQIDMKEFRPKFIAWFEGERIDILSNKRH